MESEIVEFSIIQEWEVRYCNVVVVLFQFLQLLHVRMKDLLGNVYSSFSSSSLIQLLQHNESMI